MWGNYITGSVVSLQWQQRYTESVSPEGCADLRISAYICVPIYYYINIIYIIIYPKTWSHINIYINYYTTRTSSWVFRMYNRRHAPVWCLGRSVTIVTTIFDQVPYYVPYPVLIHIWAPYYIWSPHRIPLVGRASQCHVTNIKTIKNEKMLFKKHPNINEVFIL